MGRERADPDPLAGLASLRLELTGTSHENRQALLRTLRIGSQVTIRHDSKNKYDANAIAVLYRHRQIGWIPRSANLAVLGLDVQKCKIVAVGTDEKGGWTHLSIEILYRPSKSPAGRLVGEHGAVVASILKRMDVKDVRMARKIAELPPAEQADAIDEWDSLHTNPETEEEPTHAAEGPGGGDGEGAAQRRRGGRARPG